MESAHGAWERFIKDGILNRDTDPIITESWRRCKARGLDPFDRTTCHRLPMDEVERRRDAKSDAWELAEPFLKEMYYYAEKAGFAVLLLDQDACLLETRGVGNLPKKNPHFRVGEIWSEERKGTTAIGLALIEKKPIQVTGAQHYLEYYHGACCAAAPIPDETNETVGVIALIGDGAKQHPHTLGMLAVLARVVSFELKQSAERRRKLHAYRTNAIRSSKLLNRMTGANILFTFQDIIGESRRMQRCLRQAMDIAYSKSSVIIHGESGTGKEMFAQAIHMDSGFSQGPFVAINCGAIPKDLVESELFGYEGGAFTGARKGGQPGKFEMANHGTIFLDEIGEMPLSAQISLLRVIQEKQVVRIGGHKIIPVNLRIISATNRDLAKEIQKGNFREELYYRLNVIKIHIPPLRDRDGDVLVLANHYLKEYSELLGFEPSRIDARAATALELYDWPGNVRELANAMESAVNMAKGRDITLDCLPDILAKPFVREPEPAENSVPVLYSGSDLKKQEAVMILKTLESVNWNISRCAQALGIARNTLYRKMRKYGITAQ